MKAVSEFSEIYLYRPFVDMRKQINGLSQIVETNMHLVPKPECLFGFTHRRRKLFKLLYWNGTGFALWMTRLEKASFPWPKDGDDVYSVTDRELMLLLSGIDITKQPPHQHLSYSTFS